MRTTFILTCLILTCSILTAQNVTEMGIKKELTKNDVHFEGHNHQGGVCVPPELRSQIEIDVKSQVEKLSAEGKLLSNNVMLKNMGALEWPLRANNYNHCGYFSVFQYFDHNPAFGAVQDWNCGTLTYDVPGYNHSGTDIGIAPFPWNMMQDENVEVIAAAGGQIIQKGDGNFDMECTASNLNWNYIVIQHSDGSYAMYGHMKNGSLTSLEVGDQINTGDYIGLVGSSGASTGPHLHFEILDSNFDSYDPYAGPCNSQGSSSMWANQHDYYHKGINRVMTHSAPPNSNTCPSLETKNEQTHFEPGSSVYLGVYLRHALNTDTYTLNLIRPDGTSYWSNTHTPSTFYASYMFYQSMYIPAFEQQGQWTLSVNSDYGDSCATTFTVSDCETDLNLSGPIAAGLGQIKEEAANVISSTAVINTQADVIYDAGQRVDLNAGFEVKQGALFEAYIDGCGGQ